MVRWRTFAGLAGLRRARSAPLGISPGISRVRGRQITPSMISAAPGGVTDRVAAERRESRGGQKGLALPLCPVLGRRAGSLQPFSYFGQNRRQHHKVRKAAGELGVASRAPMAPIDHWPAQVT